MGGTAAMPRSGMASYQNQFWQLKSRDFVGAVETPPASAPKRKRAPLRLTHKLEQCDDWVTVSGVQKRRQRSCKVRALLRTDRKKKSYATTYFCERGSVDYAKCWLCNKIRRQYKGVAKTCFENWHDEFYGGLAIFTTLGERVVMRRPPKEAYERKKTCREHRLHECAEEYDDEHDEE